MFGGDHGYFGKGMTGYMHYMQAFDENFGKGGGGGQGGGNSGCLPFLIVCFVVYAVLTLLTQG